jgi:hypothetical protein
MDLDNLLNLLGVVSFKTQAYFNNCPSSLKKMEITSIVVKSDSKIIIEPIFATSPAASENEAHL